MLSSVCVGTNDLEAAGKFYDRVLETIGMVRMVTVDREIGYGSKGDQVAFWVLLPFNDQPASFGNGTQVIFHAPSREAVDAFHQAALDMGGTDEGAPGLRDYRPNYYGAYCRDIDGNKLHAEHGG